MAELGFRAKEVNEQKAPSSGGNKPVLKTANRPTVIFCRATLTSKAVKTVTSRIHFSTRAV